MEPHQHYKAFASRLPDNQFSNLRYNSGNDRVWTSLDSMVTGVVPKSHNGIEILHDHSRVRIAGWGARSLVYIRNVQGVELLPDDQRIAGLRDSYFSATHIDTHLIHLVKDSRPGQYLLQYSRTSHPVDLAISGSSKMHYVGSDPETWQYILDTLVAELDSKLTD